MQKDSCRKKLTELVFGREQRACRAAAGAAVLANSGSGRVHGAASGGLFIRDGLARVQSGEDA
jgi:hypothetical protein